MFILFFTYIKHAHTHTRHTHIRHTRSSSCGGERMLTYVFILFFFSFYAFSLSLPPLTHNVKSISLFPSFFIFAARMRYFDNVVSTLFWMVKKQKEEELERTAEVIFHSFLFYSLRHVCQKPKRPPISSFINHRPLFRGGNKCQYSIKGNTHVLRVCASNKPTHCVRTSAPLSRR